MESEEKLLLEVFGLLEGGREALQKRALRIAYWLINDKAELQRDRLDSLVQAVKKYPYILSSHPELEVVFNNKLLKILQHLQEKPYFWKRIKMFSLPLCHKSAEKIVMRTVKENKLDNALLRRAVLSSCFVILRQNIGSCFATAPAILIHEEQIESFLDDLYALLSQGMLKRTYSGVQHTAFLSLYEDDDAHPLVKSWEFTLASFSEKQHEFVKWNLQVSLGLDPEIQGGIGQVIYTCLEEMLDEANGKVQMYQKECTLAWDKIRSVEGLSRHAGSESEARRLQAEHQSHLYHLRACQEMRDEAHTLASHYSDFFSFLVDHYSNQFTEEFQEIYDPKIRGDISSVYGDTPAGFRLVYKHGRKDPIAWSFLHSAKEYIHCMENFFKVQETMLLHTCTWKGGSACIEKITTAILQTLGEPSFIEGALERTQNAHKKLFKEGVYSTPWAYISGGTMDTLLNVYYRKEGSFTEEKACIEGVIDLITFIVDNIKNLSPNEMEPFIKNRNKRMLMCCVGHAFTLLPGWQPWLAAWQQQKFTYTWIRDELIEPRKHYYANLLLAYEEQLLLLKTFYKKEWEKFVIHLSSSDKTPMELREYVQSIDAQSITLFDAFLYSALPVKKGKLAYELVLEVYQDYLQNHSPFANEDVYEKIVRSVYPFPPLIFADTNWAHYYFAFVLNPGTCEIELWRTDRLGVHGAPMDTWNQYMDGTNTSLWKMYTQYVEYAQNEKHLR